MYPCLAPVVGKLALNSSCDVILKNLQPLWCLARGAGFFKPRPSSVPALDEGPATPTAPVKGERELPWINSGTAVPAFDLLEPDERVARPPGNCL
jgi:hypothetical protein